MQITDQARDLIKSFLTQKNAEGLRMYIDGSCCSVHYAFSTEPPKESDVVTVINGIQVAFDQEIGDTEEFILDMEEDENGVGLVLTGNPPKTGGCGCGGHD